MFEFFAGSEFFPVSKAGKVSRVLDATVDA